MSIAWLDDDALQIAGDTAFISTGSAAAADSALKVAATASTFAGSALLGTLAAGTASSTYALKLRSGATDVLLVRSAVMRLCRVVVGDFDRGCAGGQSGASRWHDDECKFNHLAIGVVWRTDVHRVKQHHREWLSAVVKRCS
jgi:hypothetical protein